MQRINQDETYAAHETIFFYFLHAAKFHHWTDPMILKLTEARVKGVKHNWERTGELYSKDMPFC